ncbi:MAG: ABC transporter ATP-binding protein [Candidatus Faecenecus gallistercoris]|nr:ABC transporter ATP-binding protein/permease [Bacillota bacterium]MDD7102627.1 ABC transporter ATP-binding protein [Bacillota bacterium]MDY4050591.1 ABC transporter ATP-binding protein [Candidatus Faecenecus gallistercoris]
MFKLFKNLTKKDVITILISVVLIVFQVWLDLKLPDYMSEITRLVQTEGSTINDILVQGGYMLACAGGSLIAMIIVGYLTSSVSANFSRTLGKKVFEKVQGFSMEEIKLFSTSSLITRTTNDITNVQMLISMGTQLIIKAPITAVWAVFKILNKSWTWSMLTGLAVLILLVTIAVLVLTVLPKFKIVQKLIDNINALTRENLTGIRVARAFNAEKYQEDKFEVGNHKLTSTQLFNQRMMSIMSPIMYLIMNLLTLGIYFLGASLISDAGMASKLTLFSDMVVFSSYAMQVIMSFLMLAMIFIMYPRASVSADRINEVLETETKIKDGKFSGKTKKEGEVEFKNVSFMYPDSQEYVLKDISFTAKKGEVVAFIGSTGSGKSTLINLVPRFYDATRGEVLVDGINVKDYKLEILHNKLGYVPQRAVMFGGSVNYNVAYGENGKGKKSEKKIQEAVHVAQAEDFVLKMPETYDSYIASGGTNVSGGQKQRLAIARAIARDPEIYIFDDSFSALDYKTDFVLRSELKKYMKNATSLIVAQRIGTIINADKIIVLDKGECVGMGTHQELMKTCKVYQEIAYSQLSKEELENA